MFNPLMIDVRRHLMPLFEGEDGAGGGENTGDAGNGGEGGEGANDGGNGQADEKSGQKPDAVLGGQTGKPDDKAAEGEGASNESGSDDGAGDNAVPGEGESYEFTMPDGVELDEAMAEALSPALREANIGQADANKLAGLLAGYMAEQAKGQLDAYVKKVEDWTAAAKKDPELGSDWATNTKIANAGLLKFGTPELTAALEETGMSNHPEMIRFMYRIAKATGNDTLDRGKEVDTSDIPTETGWYGKTTPNKKAG